MLRALRVLLGCTSRGKAAIASTLAACVLLERTETLLGFLAAIAVHPGRIILCLAVFPSLIASCALSGSFRQPLAPNSASPAPLARALDSAGRLRVHSAAGALFGLPHRRVRACPNRYVGGPSANAVLATWHCPSMWREGSQWTAALPATSESLSHRQTRPASSALSDPTLPWWEETGRCASSARLGAPRLRWAHGGVHSALLVHQGRTV